MRLLFAGSGPFGAAILDALTHSPHRLLAVVSQPDRPAGRRRELKPTPVGAQARAAGLALHCPEALDDDAAAPLARESADALIVADYGQILPPSWLGLCPGGSINVHASLLPRWRGAAPIARAIEAGDAGSGCTLMLMDEGLDTGAILAQETLAFADDDTTASARARLGELGGHLLLRYLESFDPAHPSRRAQDHAQACHAPKLRKADAAIDWNRPAQEIARKIRAYSPAPVATARLGQETVRLWHAMALPDGVGRPPGAILDCGAAGLRVAAAEGAVVVTELQRPGRARLPAAEFCRGVRWAGRALA